jgi:hypothetical protein
MSINSLNGGFLLIYWWTNWTNNKQWNVAHIKFVHELGGSID